MEELSNLGKEIKTLKKARDILQNEYSQSDFHKMKEAHPHSTVPPSPDDEEIYKLLTTIRQIDYYVKKLQDEQFELLKKQDQ